MHAILNPKTPILDRLSAVAASMKLDPRAFALAKAEAVSRALVPGQLVRLTQREVGLLVAFNDEEFSVFPGHEYPLLAETTFGLQECRLEDVQLLGADRALATLEDGSQCVVRVVREGAAWRLRDARGVSHTCEDLLALNPLDDAKA